jgi:NAD+ kinase
MAIMNGPKDPIEKVAVLAHRDLLATNGMVEQVRQYLDSRGIEVYLGDLEDENFAGSLINGSSDMIVALGGDGTMLRAGELGAEGSTPVLGINHGRLGFLMEVKRGEWQDALNRVLDGDYWLERRARIQISLERAGEQIGQWEALNECVVGRGRTARPIRIRAEVDEHYLASYVADAVICATATGSTAYALAGGGPILPPDLRNMILVPVAPHLSVDQAIVLPEGATLKLHVGDGPPVDLSCDGWLHHELEFHDQVSIGASPEDALFVRLEDPGYFFRNLMEYISHDPTKGKGLA